MLEVLRIMEILAINSMRKEMMNMKEKMKIRTRIMPTMAMSSGMMSIRCGSTIGSRQDRILKSEMEDETLGELRRDSQTTSCRAQIEQTLILWVSRTQARPTQNSRSGLYRTRITINIFLIPSNTPRNNSSKCKRSRRR